MHYWLRSSLRVAAGWLVDDVDLGTDRAIASS
jgi:hypothetical protein